jgi:hypothetical protein
MTCLRATRLEIAVELMGVVLTSEGKIDLEE